MDIEKLLKWVYVDELPKRGDGADGGSSTWSTLISLGTVVDRSRRSDYEPGYCAAAGETHPDAHVVEAAVQRLRTVAVDWRESRVAIMGDMAGLIDPDDAILSLAAVDPRPLLTKHAILGGRPDWTRERPQPKRMQGRNGRAVVEGVDMKGQYRRGACCPLVYDPDPRTLAAERIDYAAWREALGLLVQNLQGVLTEHDVTGPVAPLRPWAESEPQAARVLHLPPPAPIDSFKKRRSSRPRKKAA